jgi:hypothetical protein
MNPLYVDAVDRVILGLCLWLVGATMGYYVPTPWIWIPAAAILGWLAGQRIGDGITLARNVRRRERGQ